MKTRDERRHLLERMKKRVAKTHAGWMRHCDEAEKAKHIGRIANTRTPCSCPMCGHKRKWEGATIQERRAAAGDDPTVTQHNGELDAEE